MDLQRASNAASRQKNQSAREAYFLTAPYLAHAACGLAALRDSFNSSATA
jgi:hypothetical protein